MNLSTFFRIGIQSAAAVCLCVPGLGLAAPTPELVPGPRLAGVWGTVSTRDRLNLVRVAELDATRLLAERIFGFSVNGQTTVRALAELDDRVTSEVTAIIQGVKSAGEPVFHEDGRVEVLRQVVTDQVIRVVMERSVEGKGGGLVRTESQTSQRTEEVVLDALGAAAIPGSEGHRRILARRAAEVDAGRRLAARVAGTRITSTSTVADLALSDDRLSVHVADAVKMAETVRIRYLGDGSAEVTLRLKVGPLVRLIKRRVKDGSATVVSDTTTEQLRIEETGTGTADLVEGREVEVRLESVVAAVLKEAGEK